MGILVGLLALGVIIFVHELGHLIAAKKSGIVVYEFAVGMGPKLASKSFSGTEYSLRAIPFGGFVKLAGMDESNTVVNEEDKFQNKTWIARFITLSAGSVMNILFGFFVFFALFFFLGNPVYTDKITTVKQGSPAELSGLQVGDQIVALDGIPIEDISTDFMKVIHKSHSESEYIIDVVRNNETKQFSVSPKYDDDHKLYLIGIDLGVNVIPYSILKSLQTAAMTTLQTGQLMVTSIKMLIQGQATFKDMSGPIGIVQITSHQLNTNLPVFFHILAMISISLGLMNLLPIPVLDGGHILFLFVELLTRKPVPKKVQLILNNVFALVLILFMLFITLNDIFFWSDRTNLLESLE